MSGNTGRADAEQVLRAVRGGVARKRDCTAIQHAQPVLRPRSTWCQHRLPQIARSKSHKDMLGVVPGMVIGRDPYNPVMRLLMAEPHDQAQFVDGPISRGSTRPSCPATNKCCFPALPEKPAIPIGVAPPG